MSSCKSERARNNECPDCQQIYCNQMLLKHKKCSKHPGSSESDSKGISDEFSKLFIASLAFISADLEIFGKFPIPSTVS